MKKVLISKTKYVSINRIWAKVLPLLLFTFIFFTACQKDESANLITTPLSEVNKSFPKSALADPYVKGEDILEIIASVDQSLKTGDLEERNGNKLPFKFLGYDKSRAYKVYNDSFEITSYAFLAYTDMTDLNKLVNIVVTQKKNGKPGKPYLYEYTLQRVPNRLAPHISKIVKYKLNGVKVDIPSGNFNPCIDVICDQYNLPLGGGSTSGSGGSSGGGTGSTGGTSGTSGTGTGTGSGTSGGTGGTGTSGTITCVQQRTTYRWDGGSGNTEVIETWCSDGTYTMQINYYPNYAFTDCCDSENVSIGVEGLSFESIVQNLLSLYPTPSGITPNKDLPVVYRLRQTVSELRKRGVDQEWCDMIEHTLAYELNQLTMGDLHDIWQMVVAVAGEYNQMALLQRDQNIAQWMMAIFSPDNVGIILSFPNIVAPKSSTLLKSKINLYLAKKATKLCSDLSKGFDTYYDFKKVYGNAPEGHAWHHLVEQNTVGNVGFNPRKIYHPENSVILPHGSGTHHSRINAAFQTIGQYRETGNLSLRQWLRDKPYEVHMEWGLRVFNETK